MPKHIPVVVGGREVPRTVTTPPTGLETVLAITRTDRSLHRHLEAALKPHNLSVTQWLALGLVATAGEQGLAGQQLADGLGVMAAQSSVVANALAKRLVIKQRPKRTDYRSKIFIATAKGRSLFDDAQAAVEEALDGWLQTVPKNYLSIYHKVIQTLSRQPASR